MTEFERALMHRDEISKSKAERERSEAHKKLNEILENGGSYDDVEEMMACDYGLEMDYIFDLI